MASAKDYVTKLHDNFKETMSDEAAATMVVAMILNSIDYNIKRQGNN